MKNPVVLLLLGVILSLCAFVLVGTYLPEYLPSSPNYVTEGDLGYKLTVFEDHIVYNVLPSLLNERSEASVPWDVSSEIEYMHMELRNIRTNLSDLQEQIDQLQQSIDPTDIDLELSHIYQTMEALAGDVFTVSRSLASLEDQLRVSGNDHGTELGWQNDHVPENTTEIHVDVDLEPLPGRQDNEQAGKVLEESFTESARTGGFVATPLTTEELAQRIAIRVPNQVETSRPQRSATEVFRNLFPFGDGTEERTTEPKTAEIEGATYIEEGVSEQELLESSDDDAHSTTEQKNDGVLPILERVVEDVTFGPAEDEYILERGDFATPNGFTWSF